MNMVLKLIFNIIIYSGWILPLSFSYYGLYSFVWDVVWMKARWNLDYNYNFHIFNYSMLLFFISMIWVFLIILFLLIGKYRKEL